MKKKMLTALYVFLGAVAIELAATLIMSYVSIVLAALTGYVLYMGYTYYCLYRSNSLKPSIISLAAILGCCILSIPLFIIGWNETLPYLPVLIMHILGILSGYILWKAPKNMKALIIILGVLLCVAFRFCYRYWIDSII